jgi:hypothetical protein
MLRGKSGETSVGEIYTVIFVLVDGIVMLNFNTCRTAANKSLEFSMCGLGIDSTSPATLRKCRLGLPETEKGPRPQIDARWHIEPWRQLTFKDSRKA